MNREDVAMDVTVQNVEILRERLEQAEDLLRDIVDALRLGRGFGWEDAAADRIVDFLASQQSEGFTHFPELLESVKQMDAMLKAEGAQGERESELEKVLACGDATHDEQEQAAHEIRLLANALGECIQAAGITEPGAQLTGPQLLMFAEDLKHDLQRAALAQPSPAPELERPEVVTHSDDAAVDRFSASMKQKLEAARAKGRSGWDDPSCCDVAFLAERLIEHLGKGNAGTFEDVANFAMMLHQRGAHPQVLAEAAGAIERDYLRIIQAQEEKWSGRFEVLEDEAKTLRRERDAAQARVAELEQCLYQMQEAAKSLSAPVAELEKQEPVAWALQRKSDGFVRATWNQKPSETQYEIAELDGDVIVPLYAAPVAQAGQVPEGYMVLQTASLSHVLGLVECAMEDAYGNAFQVCCGKGRGGECCGDPEAGWSPEDQRTMDVLNPIQRELRAMLDAAQAQGGSTDE